MCTLQKYVYVTVDVNFNPLKCMSKTLDNSAHFEKTMSKNKKTLIIFFRTNHH